MTNMKSFPESNLSRKYQKKKGSVKSHLTAKAEKNERQFFSSYFFKLLFQNYL